MSEWKIKRGEEEFTAQNEGMLFNWATSGRVRRDDYVFNPVLQRWMYARELAELATAFPQQPAAQMIKASSAAKGSCGLAIALFLFAVMLGMMGMGQGIAMLLTAGAFIFAIVSGILYVLKK